MRTADALLVDLDGTIVDSRLPYTRSLNAALRAVGLQPHPPAELHRYLGPPIHETLVEHLGVPPELVDEIIARYRERYAGPGLQETTAFPGVLELLHALHGRVRLALATSKVQTLAEPLLERLGVRELFEVVAAPLPDAVNESKATTVATALRRLGGATAPVMVGDRRHDVEGAAAHGVPTIGVLWGVGSEAELREAGAWALVRQPEEIPALIGL